MLENLIMLPNVACDMQICPQQQVKITRLKHQQDLSPLKYNVVQTMETREKYAKKTETKLETAANAVIRNANDAQNHNRSSKQQAAAKTKHESAY
ncbi:hypothetical protein ACLKA7_013014 [Drosophila subpalustris]